MTRDITLKVDTKLSDDPLIVSFPQGIPMMSHDEDEGLEFTASRKATHRRSEIKVKATLDTVPFGGSNNSSNKDTSNYLIGVLDEKTNELRIIRATTHIYVVKPELIAKDNAFINRLSTMSNIERRQSLTEEFGSRKKKRAMHAAQSNIILSENISGATAVESAMNEQFESLEANSILLNAAEEALEQNRLALLPTYDVSATVQEDAYPIHDLISSDISDLVEQFIENLLEDPSKDFRLEAKQFLVKDDCGYLVGSVLANSSLSSILAEVDKKTKKKQKSKLIKLVILHFMMKFYKMMASSHHNTVKKTDISEAFKSADLIAGHIADTFVTTRRHQGQWSYSATKSNM